MQIIVRNPGYVFVFDNIHIKPNALRNIREMLEIKKDFTTLKVIVLADITEDQQDKTLAELADIEKEIQKDPNNLTFELVI